MAQSDANGLQEKLKSEAPVDRVWPSLTAGGPEAKNSSIVISVEALATDLAKEQGGLPSMLNASIRTAKDKWQMIIDE